MQYKVVPVPAVIRGQTYSAADYIEKTINEEARNGWKFCSMGSITAEQPLGCLALFMPPKRTETNLLVFCKEDAASAPAHTQTSVPVKPRTYVPAEEAMWTCAKCGTQNKGEYGMCKKCGAYRSSN